MDPTTIYNRFFDGGIGQAALQISDMDSMAQKLVEEESTLSTDTLKEVEHTQRDRIKKMIKGKYAPSKRDLDGMKPDELANYQTMLKSSYAGLNLLLKSTSLAGVEKTINKEMENVEKSILDVEERIKKPHYEAVKQKLAELKKREDQREAGTEQTIVTLNRAINIQKSLHNLTGVGGEAKIDKALLKAYKSKLESLKAAYIRFQGLVQDLFVTRTVDEVNQKEVEIKKEMQVLSEIENQKNLPGWDLPAYTTRQKEQVLKEIEKRRDAMFVVFKDELESQQKKNLDRLMSTVTLTSKEESNAMLVMRTSVNKTIDAFFKIPGADRPPQDKFIEALYETVMARQEEIGISSEHEMASLKLMLDGVIGNRFGLQGG